MIGKGRFWAVKMLNSLRKQRVAAAIAVPLVLVLQCVDAHAELLFRSLEQVKGQQTWSSIKKYSNPADTAYARGPANVAEEVRVILSGEITRADLDSAAVMADLLKSGKQKLSGNTLWLASNGGDIDTAMELARLLRKSGIFTLIGKNDQCLSACVFAFMGGERRSVAGRLGIHRPFFPFTHDFPDRQSRFRHLQKILKDFVEEMDFPTSLYEAVMQVPPEAMQMLAQAELKKFYLEGISPASEDLADAAAARRLKLSMFDYLKRKANSPPCGFFDAGQGRCEGRVQDAAASGGAADESGLMQKGEAAAAGRAPGRATGDAQGSGTSRSTNHGARGPS